MYNKQFLLTKREVQWETDWKSRQVGGYWLYTHPALSVAEKKEDGYHFVMLGYWYDYRNPGYTDQQVMDSLTIKGTLNEVVGQTDHLCGVYLMLWSTPEKFFVIPDFCALSEAYILKPHHEVIAIAASPELLQVVQPLVEDEHHPYYSTELFKSKMQWIGVSTSFKNVLRLRPNHYLNVVHGEFERFYPTKKLERQPMDVVVQKMVQVLPNLMSAVFSRGEKVMVGLTAGWDSRLLLASCRGLKDKVTFFVDISACEKQDMHIPERLATRLDLSFCKVRFAKNSKPTNRVFDTTFILPITKHKLSVFDSLFGSYNTISGSVSEVARNEFARINKLDGKKLNALARFPAHDFVATQFEDWYQKNKTLFETQGYQVLDMFYWEEVLGKAARLITEARNIDRTILPAFNCRYLMESMLSTDEKYRDKQYNILYAEAIKVMWNEVLIEPVNPSVKKTIIRFMQRLGIYGLYRNIFTTGIFNSSTKKK